MCRVFKKSPNGKKHLLSTSQIPSPLSSPCNTATVTELGELDASILNNMVNPSGSFNSMQAIESSSNNNNSNMNMYMNWMQLTREATSQNMLSWPASLLGTGLMSANPASALKASPFNGYQPPDGTNISSLNSLLGQGDHSFHASSSKAMDPMMQQQQQQHEHESIWRGY